MNVEHLLQKSLHSSTKEELETTFDTIFNQFYKLVYFIALQYVKNDADAEDITQDVFLTFFNKIAGSTLDKPIKNIKSYLCTLAKNNALDLVKNKAYQNLEYNNEINGNEDCYEFFDESFVNIWHEALDDNEQEIIINKIIFEFSFKEIAKELNMNANTVKTKYTRALKKLRERMKGYE